MTIGSSARIAHAVATTITASCTSWLTCHAPNGALRHHEPFAPAESGSTRSAYAASGAHHGSWPAVRNAPANPTGSRIDIV